MWNPFGRHSSVPKEEVSGITVLFLQKRFQTFSDDELNGAMAKAWGKKYDETSFFGLSTFDGEGAVLKTNDMIYTMQHMDRPLDAALLEQLELPPWAEHTAHSKFGYACPGGIPPGKVRDQLGWLIGRLAAELLGKNTVALFFVEAGVLVPFNKNFDQALRKNIGENPEILFSMPSADRR